MDIPTKITNVQVQLFFEIFKGREDVYAQRWEKRDKSGYMPAYDYDLYLYRLHKKKGGTFKSYKDKSYKKLTVTALKNHLEGSCFLGVYPLLRNNHSWFIVADFDKGDWQTESLQFIRICTEYGLKTYLERSRSGDGAHVWMFFVKPYPAQKSRRIFLEILIQSSSASIFDKGTSFDRLFPNQDILSGKGLGNLIALPLNRDSLQSGNNCFLDIKTLTPFPNQWEFLETVERVDHNNLDTVYRELIDSSVNSVPNKSSQLEIRLEGKLVLNKSAIPSVLVNFLKDALHFPNEEFFVRQNMGKSTYGIDRYFKFIEENDSSVLLPRGFVKRLLLFCKKENIDFTFIDERIHLQEVDIRSKIEPLKHQLTAIEKAAEKDFGVIVAPPGSGKTVIGLKIIENKRQPALIIVHRKHLLEQWIERIEDFLGIPKREIGKIGQGKAKIGNVITVALIQSLEKAINRDENIFQKFGLVIVDECHHIPAKSYYSTFSKMSPYYQYGLTATPFRKKKDEALIFAAIGEIISEITSGQIESFQRPRVVIRNTSFDVPFDSKIDKYELLSNMLINDVNRNRLILYDIERELYNQQRILIITERKAHIEILAHLLKHKCEVVTLSGDMPSSQRTKNWQLIKAGQYQVLITTGQLLGEGVDITAISRLFLVYPFAFKGKLIQYIGRVQRSKVKPVIYDYRDTKVDYLEKLFLKRSSHYHFFDKQATLFDELEVLPTRRTIELKEQLKIPISELTFHYRRAVFSYQNSNLNSPIHFDIFHEDLRPEFDILKPYFEKVLNRKNVSVDIQALIEDSKVLSQSAESEEIKAIDENIIERVRFNFFQKEILKPLPESLDGPNIKMIDGLEQKNSGIPVFETKEQLISTLLQDTSYKHFDQVKYLVAMHDYKVFKIRFVLSPFSFLFLLTSEASYHLVLETLDTEEATYIWSCKKELPILKARLKKVEKHLEIIKNEGRQSLLGSSPKHFARILHDYSDKGKGFLVWKNTLEDYLLSSDFSEEEDSKT